NLRATPRSVNARTVMPERQAAVRCDIRLSRLDRPSAEAFYMADQSAVGSHSIVPPSLRSARLFLLAVLLPTLTPGRADAFAAADFAGTWRLSVLGTRPVGASADSTLTAPLGATVDFDQTGTVLDTTSSGRLSITDVGVVTGILTNVVFVTGVPTNV